MRIYHNPRCSKSRQAIKLLTEAAFDFEEYRFLYEGVDSDDAKILSSLPNIVRKKDVFGDVSVQSLDSEGIQQHLYVHTGMQCEEGCNLRNF